MASRRRGGPPDLKSTLGTLLRTTLDQFGAVKDVVETQARSHGGILDQALSQRRRKDAMAELGEAIYRLSQQGKLGELALEPEIGLAIAAVDELNAPHGFAESVSDRGGLVPRPSSPEAVSSANYRPPSPDPSKEFRVWRPVMPEDDDDGDEENHNAPPKSAESTSASSRIPRKVAQRSRGGGIHFVDEEARTGDIDSDDDLASYMHDDDV